MVQFSTFCVTQNSIVMLLSPTTWCIPHQRFRVSSIKTNSVERSRLAGFNSSINVQYTNWIASCSVMLTISDFFSRFLDCTKAKENRGQTIQKVLLPCCEVKTIRSLQSKSTDCGDSGTMSTSRGWWWALVVTKEESTHPKPMAVAPEIQTHRRSTAVEDSGKKQNLTEFREVTNRITK